MRLTNQTTANGFVLLEVLVAMSLILGVWMTSIAAYQGLVLRFKQQESRRSELMRTFDEYELAEQTRASRSQIATTNVPHIACKGVKNESSRVSNRNCTMHSVVESAIKNEF